MASLEIERSPQDRLTTRHLIAAHSQAVAEAAAALGRGELVVFPTDTVYGVGANAFDEEAIKSIYTIKGRPAEKGIPILLADITDLGKVAASVPQAAQNLLTQFWPGPLTLILPKRDGLPPSISTNSGIAVRIPANETARAVIRASGGAVATSSANRSGHSPAQTADQALSELGGLVDIVLDGGPTGKLVPSTIVDCTGKKLRILRQGPISDEVKQFDKSIE